MNAVQQMLWRRVDVPGHDACTMAPSGHGWSIRGAAAFQSEKGVAHLRYDVHVNAEWLTQSADISGVVGERDVDYHIRRTAKGVWLLNHLAQPDLGDCTDLDLGFTPATNTIAIRRLALDMGAGTELRSAWLDVVGDEFSPLPQRYSRESNHRYAYESSRFNFQATLRVNDFGFITDYPGLWVAEAQAGGV